MRSFVSYKRDTDPDEELALQIYKVLSEYRDVFIDKTMLVETRWAERIETELQQSDFVIILISARSVHSETMIAEVSTAHHRAKTQGGLPVILPIRVNFHERLQYPLSAYLDQINWASWESSNDTLHLIDELWPAILGRSLTSNIRPQPISSGKNQGTQPPIPLAAAQPFPA